MVFIAVKKRERGLLTVGVRIEKVSGFLERFMLQLCQLLSAVAGTIRARIDHRCQHEYSVRCAECFLVFSLPPVVRIVTRFFRVSIFFFFPASLWVAFLKPCVGVVGCGGGDWGRCRSFVGVEGLRSDGTERVGGYMGGVGVGGWSGGGG